MKDCEGNLIEVGDHIGYAEGTGSSPSVKRRIVVEASEKSIRTIAPGGTKMGGLIRNSRKVIKLGVSQNPSD